jgi:hypothetical protein
MIYGGEFTERDGLWRNAKEHAFALFICPLKSRIIRILHTYEVSIIERNRGGSLWNTVEGVTTRSHLSSLRSRIVCIIFIQYQVSYQKNQFWLL